MPDKKEKVLSLKIKGNPETLDIIERVLSYASTISQWGHSAEISFFIDGDGADSFTVEGIDASKHHDEAEALSSYGGSKESITQWGALSGNTTVWSKTLGKVVQDLGIFRTIYHDSDDPKLKEIITNYFKLLGKPKISKGIYGDMEYYWEIPEGFCRILKNDDAGTGVVIKNDKFNNYLRELKKG